MHRELRCLKGVYQNQKVVGTILYMYYTIIKGDPFAHVPSDKYRIHIARRHGLLLVLVYLLSKDKDAKIISISALALPCLG